MKISKRILFVVLVLGLSHLLKAQGSYELTPTFTKEKLDTYMEVYHTLDSINPNSLLNNPNVQWQQNKVFYGFSNDYYWLKFSVKNATSISRNLYLEVDNSHLRYIEFYELEAGELALKYKCGRYLPFDSRPVDNVKFIFPINLNSGGSGDYYVKIDKRTTSVSFPTVLWDQNEFHKINNKKNLLNGILFGGFLLILLYSLLVFLYLKRILYLWYGLYIFSIGMYLFTSIGYSFQYINQDSIAFNTVFRVITLVLTVVFHIKFIQELMKTKRYVKKLHAVMNVFAYALLLIVIGKFIFPAFYKVHSSMYIKSLYVLILFSIISYLLAALLTYKKHEKVVKLYVLSFGVLIIGALFLMAFEFGWLLSFRTTVSPLFIGSLLEIIILSVVLIGEMQLIDKEKKMLSVKIIEKQHEVVQAYMDGVEKEKLRISGELHDNIGSQLANLSRMVSHENKLSDVVQHKLVDVIEEVRTISHKLAPNKGSLLSFKEQLENLIEETFMHQDIACTYQFLGKYTDLNEKQRLNIYRILQEFLHNILKHANASIVEIQLMHLDNELTLTIEDNGIGFIVSAKNKGLGLENIQKRMDYLNGTMEISSVPKQGTFIVLAIPIDGVKT